jgi:hypothetical protein
MSKQVRIHDPVTNEIRLIPAAELAPGMIQVEIKGIGLVWVDASKVNAGKAYRHPPFDAEARDFIEKNIRVPLAEVYPRTLAHWEDGFRRDTEPETEIAVWYRIAERFTEFSTAEALNPAQKKECLTLMLHCSSGASEGVLDVVPPKALTHDQAQRAIAAFLRDP